MIKVGLTGNIGSGKSTVTGIFEVLGVPVFHADKEAGLIMKRGEVLEAVRSRFGAGVFQGGALDRQKLAAVVFNDKTALADLNAIVHPRVRKNLEIWMGQQKHQPYVLQEAAILFETGFHAYFNKTIVVSCPDDIAIARVMARDGVGKEEVMARMRNQWPAAKKTDLADYVINNDGAHLVIPQVLSIHNELKGQ
jgi:dephospho-CoA kinase